MVEVSRGASISGLKLSKWWFLSKLERFEDE